ncbi:MAG: MFS transporter [Clostridioides sp.]|jgi:MFS family permease|nr:MFS transporter [Clostridioides sp.]
MNQQQNTKQSKIFYGWYVVIGCALLTMCIVPLVMSLSSKFLIAITTEMNISRSAFTFSNTILQALGIFLSPFAAKLLVKKNMKVVQSISIIGFVLAYASYALAQNVIHLYISSFFIGVFYIHCTFIPVSMVITNWFVKKRGLAMSIAMSGIGVGGLVFSPIVTHLLGQSGWRTTYLIMACVVLVICLPVSLFVLKKHPEDIGLKPYGADSEDNNVQQSNSEEHLGVKLSVKESYGKLFFIMLCLAMFTNGLMNSASTGQFPPAIEEMHGAIVQATIISVYSFVGMFGKLLLGWINDKFGVVISSIYGCGCFILAFICMLFGHNITMLYAMAILFGLGAAVGTVSPTLIVSEVFGSKKYGEAYGITNSIMQIGMALGSIMAARLYDTTGSYNSAWVIVIVLAAITMFGWVYAKIGSRKYM